MKSSPITIVLVAVTSSLVTVGAIEFLRGSRPQAPTAVEPAVAPVGRAPASSMDPEPPALESSVPPRALRERRPVTRIACSSSNGAWPRSSSPRPRAARR